MNAITNKQVKANRTNCITNDINDLWVYLKRIIEIKTKKKRKKPSKNVIQKKIRNKNCL